MNFPSSFIVSGVSMSPTLRAGDKVFLDPVLPKSLKIGELLAFKNLKDQIPSLHRLLWIGKAHLLTAGDAHWRVDSPVPFEHLIGRVVRVEPGDRRSPFPEPGKNLLHCFSRKTHFVLKKCLLNLKESDSLMARKTYSVLSCFRVKYFIQRKV